MNIIDTYLKSKAYEPHIREILKAKQETIKYEIKIWNKEIEKLQQELKTIPIKYHVAVKTRLKEAQDESLKWKKQSEEINSFLKENNTL